jgi:hypothetical protein
MGAGFSEWALVKEQKACNKAASSLTMEVTLGKSLISLGLPSPQHVKWVTNPH